MRVGLYLAALVAGGIGAAQAAPVSGADAVRLIATAMAEVGLSAPAMPAPVRPLPPCDHPPAVAPRQGNWATVELRCNAPQPWVRALRTGAPAVAMPTRAGDSATSPDRALETVLVLAHPLPRGARLGPADLVAVAVEGRVPTMALTDPDQAIGRQLRVALAPGQPLLDRQLEPRRDAGVDERVTLILAVGDIEIATVAQVLQPGRVGDVLRMRNLGSGREIDAVLVAPGLARIRPNIP